MNIQPFLNSLKNIWAHIGKRFEWLANNVWFAYLTIILLQLKRIWGAWEHKDLTYGDTSHYFISALGWAHEFSVQIVWSPLYTAYYGTMLKLIPDVYWATLFHRLVIIFALAILVLAVMRHLLPSHIAWLVTTWWVILPINFNSLYEVHLFSVLLPLIATTLILYKPGIWSRGIALGILLVCMVLVRNEIIIAVSLWAIICFIWEIYEIKSQHRQKLKIYLLAYGLPILFAALIFGFFYWRTLIKPSPESLKLKHTLNVCQIYSFGYQQRYSDWQKSPWTECYELMTRDFGQELPTMVEAIQSNPRAMIEHFLWNVALFPSGLQVALFNATSGNVNPDYPPVLMNSSIVLIPSLIVLMLFIVGVSRFIKERKYWWSFWIKKHIWGWLMLFCLSAIMFLVVPMQRPRPSYMFLLTLTVMAVIGMCFFIVVHRSRLERHFPAIASLIMIALIFFVPSFFSKGERPLLNFYRRLSPRQEVIGIPETSIVINEFSQELCNYYAQSFRSGCTALRYNIFQSLDENVSMGQILEEQPLPITLIYLDENFFNTYGNIPSVQAFLADPQQLGWKLVAMQDEGSNEIWQIYVKMNFNSSAP